LPIPSTRVQDHLANLQEEGTATGEGSQALAEVRSVGVVEAAPFTTRFCMGRLLRGSYLDLFVQYSAVDTHFPSTESSLVYISQRSEPGISMYGNGSSQLAARNLHPSGFKVEAIGSDSVDHKKMTMRTRFAVRDKSPHRFQIVPLREVDKLVCQGGTSTGLDVPSTRSNYLSVPPTKLGSYSQKRVQSVSSRLSLGKSGKENFISRNMDTHDSESVAVLQGPLSNGLKFYSADYPARKGVLFDVDFNRTGGPVLALPGNHADKYSLPANTSYLPAHTEPPTTIAAYRASHQDSKHQTLTTQGGIHVSEIAQSSEDSALLISRRRTALTVTAAGSDTSGVVPDDLEMEIKLKRRHAIYRESSHAPRLGRPRSSQSNGGGTSESENYCSSTSCSESRSSVSRLSGKREFSSNDGDGTDLDLLYNLDDEEATPRKLLQAPVVSGKSRFAASSERSSFRARSVRPLKLLKNSRSRPATPSISGEIVYPGIIQDLFQDIDDALYQWGKI
jgi:hypothetical protein